MNRLSVVHATSCSMSKKNLFNSGPHGPEQKEIEVTLEYSSMQYYLLIIEGDISIRQEGPFAEESEMNEAAKKHKEENGDEDGLHWMTVSTGPSSPPFVEVGDWSGAFFEEE